MAGKIAGPLTLLLGAIAGVSLAVGGIGIKVNSIKLRWIA